MGDSYGSREARKKMIGEQLWLHYYNQVLFERGMITEDERNRMANRINARNNLRNDKGSGRVYS